MMNKNKCSVTLGISNCVYEVKFKHLHWISYLYPTFQTLSCDLWILIRDSTSSVTYRRQCIFLGMSPLRPTELSMAIFLPSCKITRIYSACYRFLQQCRLPCRSLLQLHGSLPFPLIKALPSEIYILFIMHPWASQRKRL